MSFDVLLLRAIDGGFLVEIIHKKFISTGVLLFAVMERLKGLDLWERGFVIVFRVI